MSTDGCVRSALLCMDERLLLWESLRGAVVGGILGTSQCYSV